MDWLLSVIDARACWLLRPSTYIWCDVQHRRTQDFDAWIKFKLCMQKPIDNQTPLSQKQPKKKTPPRMRLSQKSEKKRKKNPPWRFCTSNGDISHFILHKKSIPPSFNLDNPSDLASWHSIFVAKTATFNLWNVTGRCDHHTTFPVGVVR